MNYEILLCMRNNLQDLTRLVSEADQFMQSHCLSPRTVYCVNLVLEEVLTNIVKYAFDDASAHEIQLILTIKDSEVIVTCEDAGREFDPLAIPSPEARDSILECEVGGLGIHLVRKTVHSMEYFRDRHKNVLIMTIKKAERQHNSDTP
ncbi:MAG: ATP-binding protein [Desulfomonile tiedjei]|uniref:ATP-binding protein n=1 Tax=Desulfomonile tiedjei TaxID=2358 RepID=A0A9D6V7V5_9BACT|nr:ATP-binding protein [Desulfomonile tiedjei]